MKALEIVLDIAQIACYAAIIAVIVRRWKR